MKYIVVGLLIFASQVSLGQQENSRKLTPEQVYDYLNEATENINQIQLEENSSYVIGETAVGDKCVAFMDKKQFLGSIGAAIFKNVVQNSKNYPILIQGGDLNRYCPKYARMDLKNKGLVWVVLLTMVAHFESSCNLKASAKGPNGTAQGLFQLHKGKEQKYTDFKKACPKNASLNAKQSGACTLAMLDDQMERSSGKIFYNESYWDVLRPNGRAQRADDIQKALTRFSLCNPHIL